ncbi:MAG: dimethyl sulfoxide reductase anchor subunit [Eggerthellaceae bacterium]|nr:dimethyl sulfoxide reductase anchor subunit [Eggerthellaceae bacterium]
MLELDSTSLAVFTTLAPAGMVAFVVMALLRSTVADHAGKRRVDHLLAIPFLLVLSGFITSTAHLGTPTNALYVITGAGRSPLSNEVVSVLAFLFLAGSYWMAAISRDLPRQVAGAWIAAGSVAAIIAVGFTSIAYSIETIPTWNTIYTPLALVAGALGAGCLLSEGIYLFAGGLKPTRSTVLLVAYALSCLVVLTAMVLLRIELDTITTFVAKASGLAMGYDVRLGFYAISSAGALCALFNASFREEISTKTRLALACASAFAALWGVFLVRDLFYQTYMTVGV